MEYYIRMYIYNIATYNFFCFPSCCSTQNCSSLLFCHPSYSRLDLVYKRYSDHSTLFIWSLISTSSPSPLSPSVSFSTEAFLQEPRLAVSLRIRRYYNLYLCHRVSSVPTHVASMFSCTCSCYHVLVMCLVTSISSLYM